MSLTFSSLYSMQLAGLAHTVSRTSERERESMYEVRRRGRCSARMQRCERRFGGRRGRGREGGAKSDNKEGKARRREDKSTAQKEIKEPYNRDEP